VSILRTSKIMGFTMALVLFGSSCRASSPQEDTPSPVLYLEEIIPPLYTNS